MSKHQFGFGAKQSASCRRGQLGGSGSSLALAVYVGCDVHLWTQEVVTAPAGNGGGRGGSSQSSSHLGHGQESELETMIV